MFEQPAGQHAVPQVALVGGQVQRPQLGLEPPRVRHENRRVGREIIDDAPGVATRQQSPDSSGQSPQCLCRIAFSFFWAARSKAYGATSARPQCSFVMAENQLAGQERSAVRDGAEARSSK